MIARLRTVDRALLGILLLALALRLAMAFWPTIHHADELWQYMEPARRVLGLDWVHSWEAESGTRSWMIPAFLAAPMGVGQIAPGLWLDLLLPRLFCAGVAMIGVVGVAKLGWRISRTHGLVAAFVAAIWFELAFFGARTLSEPLATALILGAAWLLLDERSSRRRIVLAGLMLGLACLARFQYGPAIAVLAIGAVRGDFERWKWLVAGGLGAAAISGLSELAMGAPPFLWIWNAVHANLVENRSAAYGVSPFWGFLTEYWKLWGLAGLLVIGFAALGARRYPLLLAVALTNLAVHSLIPHKEYRFILLTTAILVALAAIGSVDLLQRRYASKRAVIVLCAGWLVLSGATAALGAQAKLWGTNTRMIMAWRSAGAQPGLCGVGVYRSRATLMASKALLGRDVPIYQYDDATAPRALRSRAFNVAITPREHGGELTGYRFAECGSAKERNYCVYVREGGCATAPGDASDAIQPFLKRAGK